jgi:hypothetical protein
MIFLAIYLAIGFIIGWISVFMNVWSMSPNWIGVFLVLVLYVFFWPVLVLLSLLCPEF